MSEHADFHAVSLDAFEAVSYGYTTPEHHQAFQELVLSSRKLLLNHFVAYSRKYEDTPEGLSSVNESLAVLLQLEQQEKTAIDELLLAPATGSWLAQTVDRLENGSPGTTPLWVDIGFFANIVAGFASKHGLDFTLTAPVIQSKLHIPQQGTATLAESRTWGMTNISNQHGVLHIQNGTSAVHIPEPAIRQPQWNPVRRIITQPQSSPINPDNYSDLRLDVLLDDADPYNSGLNPYKISDAEHVEWQATIDAAWEILMRADSNSAWHLSNGLSVIVPSPQRARFEPYSSSDSISVGSIRASLPTSPLEAAEILVHEYCGHSALNTFLLATPLTPRDTVGSTLYAPWRDDPRPSGGLLHGIYSFSRVVDFYTAVRQAIPADDPQVPLVDFERTLWQAQTGSCSSDLKNLWYEGRQQFTSFRFYSGTQILSGHAMVYPDTRIKYGKQLLRLPVSRDPIRNLVQNALVHTGNQHFPKPLEHLSHTPLSVNDLVDLAKADHFAQWAAHHIRPDSHAIDVLSDDWLQGNRPTGIVIDSKVEADPKACRLHGRAILMRHLLSDPDNFMAEFDASDEPLKRADMALILGKSALAQTLYTEVLVADALSIEAFVGLGLSERLDNPSPNKYFTYHLQKPYILLALQKAITAKSGDAANYSALKEWLRTQRLNPGPHNAIKHVSSA
ncbi:MAG TPA: HEXXH motif-containing putative peptide modification protein [Candidatus Saccharimonadales bacterium]|nr:HEXXH motif-containing putative peptide modification protein [Candidatus Saccharimonadales bacterium]